VIPGALSFAEGLKATAGSRRSSAPRCTKNYFFFAAFFLVAFFFAAFFLAAMVQAPVKE
jgi:hypothetical protein